MGIAFFGINKSFDYYQIGGTDSFVRRISTELVQNGDEVDYVLYGSKRDEEIPVIPGLRMYYFRSWGDALNAIRGKGYDHVVEIYMPPWDRIAFMRFRQKHNDSIKFHIVYFGWPEQWLKRYLSFAEACSSTLNGRVFVISPRQYHYVRKWCKKPVLIWPPVPEEYFTTPFLKDNPERLRITWIGRLDLGKGIKEIIDIFRRLKDNPKVELKLCGHYWERDAQGKALHKWLVNQDEIPYIKSAYSGRAPEMEKTICELLKQTDILVLPYWKLSSTIDTPLLMLEAMAALSAVLCKPLGDIPKIYGNPFFMPDGQEFVDRSVEIICRLTREEIRNERDRIFRQNRRLNFGASAVSRRFRSALQGRDVPEIHL